MEIPPSLFFFFFFNDTATTEIYTLSLHDALPIRPTPVTARSWPAPTRNPPGTFTLALRTASATSFTVTPYCHSLSDDSRTWYCLAPPPIDTAESTPGTDRRRRPMSQSEIVRRSSPDTRSLTRAYFTSQLTAEVTGSMVGSWVPGGRFARTDCSRSLTSCRAR